LQPGLNSGIWAAREGTVDVIALTVIVMCSMGLSFAVTKAALSILFFFMNRGVLHTEAVAMASSREFSYEN
jgi:hypothetical protein